MRDKEDDEWVPEREAGGSVRSRGYATHISAEQDLPPDLRGQSQPRNSQSEPLHKLSDSNAAPEPSYCQVEGCGKDIRQEKDYYQRYRICEEHLKLGSLLKDGVPQRFCQQCGRFHLVSEFDGEKRSCRARLSLHNNRRRKRGGGVAAATEGTQSARGRRNKARGGTLSGRQAVQSPAESGGHAKDAADAVAEVRLHPPLAQCLDVDKKGQSPWARSPAARPQAGPQLPSLAGGAAAAVAPMDQGGGSDWAAARPTGHLPAGFLTRPHDARGGTMSGFEPAAPLAQRLADRGPMPSGLQSAFGGQNLLGGGSTGPAASTPEQYPAAGLGVFPGQIQPDGSVAGYYPPLGRVPPVGRQDAKSMSDAMGLRAFSAFSDVDLNDVAALHQQGLTPGLLALDPKLRQQFAVAHSVHIPHCAAGIPSPFNPRSQQQFQAMSSQQPPQFASQQNPFGSQNAFPSPQQQQEQQAREQQMAYNPQQSVQDKFATLSSQQPIGFGGGNTMATESGSSRAVSSLQRWSSDERHGWFRPSGSSNAPLASTSGRDSLNTRGMSFDQAPAYDRRPSGDTYQRPEAFGQLLNDNASSLTLGGMYNSSLAGLTPEDLMQYQMTPAFDGRQMPGAAYGNGRWPPVEHLGMMRPTGPREDPATAAALYGRVSSSLPKLPTDLNPAAHPLASSDFAARMAAVSEAVPGGALPGAYAAPPQLPAGLLPSRHLSLQPDVNGASILSGSARDGGELAHLSDLPRPQAGDYALYPETQVATRYPQSRKQNLSLLASVIYQTKLSATEAPASEAACIVARGANSRLQHFDILYHYSAGCQESSLYECILVRDQSSAISLASSNPRSSNYSSQHGGNQLCSAKCYVDELSSMLLLFERSYNLKVALV